MKSESLIIVDNKYYWTLLYITLLFFLYVCQNWLALSCFQLIQAPTNPARESLFGSQIETNPSYAGQ